MSGATEATAWNWKPIDVRVTKTIASATQRLPMSRHHIRAPPATAYAAVVSSRFNRANEPSFW